MFICHGMGSDLVKVSHETLNRYKKWGSVAQTPSPCKTSFREPYLQTTSKIIVQQLSHRTPSTLAHSEASDLASAYWDQNQ